MSSSIVTSTPYIKRATQCANPVAKELLLIMEEKQSNLAVALDVTTKEELLHLINTVGDHACIIKTHIDIVENFDIHLLLELQEQSKKRRFLILEDRKFCDIGKTVQQQYEDGIYKIVNWAHMVSAHPVPGPSVVEGLRRIGLPRGRGLFFIAEMSSRGMLASTSYTDAAVEIAHNYSDFVAGFIGRRRLTDAPHFIHMAPSIHIEKHPGTLFQDYITPEEAICLCGSDIIIVGNAITSAPSPATAALQYQEAGWHAYSKRIGKGGH